LEAAGAVLKIGLSLKPNHHLPKSVKRSVDGFLFFNINNSYNNPRAAANLLIIQKKRKKEIEFSLPKKEREVSVLKISQMLNYLKFDLTSR